MTPRTHRAVVEARLERTLPQQNIRLPANLRGDRLDAAVNAAELFHMGHRAYLRQSRADVWEADVAISRAYTAGLKHCLVLFGRCVLGIGAVFREATYAAGRWLASWFR